MTAGDGLIEDLRLLEPSNPAEAYWWVGVSFVGVLLLLLLWKWVARRRRRQRAVAGPSAAEIQSAQADALEALNSLFSLVQEEHSRRYAIESTRIIREYLERRFAIVAPLRATEEFLREAQHSPLLTQHHHETLAELLRCSDFLKFGRGRASREELELLHSAAVDFVGETTTIGGAPRT